MERDDEARARDAAPYEPSVADAVERVGGRIANAIVIAAMIVGVVVWMQPGPPRFEVVADGDRVVRIDRRSGTVIACEAGRCARILRRHQELQDSLGPEEKEAEKAEPPLSAPDQPSAAQTPDRSAQPAPAPARER